MPATGNSTLAVDPTYQLGWPVFPRDNFKELLFNVAGDDEASFDETESEQSIALLLTTACSMVNADVNVVLKGNFRADLTAQQIEPLRSTTLTIRRP